MRHQDARADLGEERREAVGVEVRIEGPVVRGHGAEVLVQRLRLAVELDAVEIVRPPPLLIGAGIKISMDGKGAWRDTNGSRYIYSSFHTYEGSSCRT